MFKEEIIQSEHYSFASFSENNIIEEFIKKCKVSNNSSLDK
jgi:hypothetical protein